MKVDCRQGSDCRRGHDHETPPFVIYPPPASLLFVGILQFSNIRLRQEFSSSGVVVAKALNIVDQPADRRGLPWITGATRLPRLHNGHGTYCLLIVSPR